MNRNFVGSRARQFTAGLALCTLAAAAQADPFSLEGACHLTSLVAPGQCLIEYSLTDQAQSVVFKNATVRIDNVVVHRYLNDSVNPSPFSFVAVNGSTQVSCGVSHVVTAFFVRVGVGMPLEKGGTLPAILCPTAP
jgi:hypothetical protein